MKKNYSLTWLRSLLCLCLIVLPGLLWAASTVKTSKAPAKTEPVNQSAEAKTVLTVTEIIKLKEAGISEATIHLLIKERQLPQNVKERAFANEHMGTWSVKDAPDKEAIIYSTGTSQRLETYNEEDYRRAKELLPAMPPLIVPLVRQPSANK